MSYYHCHLQFAPGAMNREELRKFEKKCRSDPQSARHFLGVKGRTFYFRFDSELARRSFLLSVERQLNGLGLASERLNADLWPDAAPAARCGPWRGPFTD